MSGNAECAACHGEAESEDGRNAEEGFKLGKSRLLLKAMLSFHGEVETGRQAEEKGILGKARLL